MISVSNEFKKAIKKTERQIKGYVEVLYDLPASPLPEQTNTNIDSTYTSFDQVFNGMRVENLYGSLDYLPLNGEYITMDDGINQNAGLISDELAENLSVPHVVVGGLYQTTLNGITLYFRTNIPKNLRFIFNGDEIYDIENNDKEMIQIIFDNPKTLNYIIISFFRMEYPDRKIYINEIDLGITQVYKDQDLIEFTVDEEVNKLVEEVPTNETNIVLNNMSDLFNPLNPQGIVPYLTEKTLIKPYIGVFTENSGIEYVKMGEFYFDSYTNNSDATTTLIGKNIIKQVETEILKADNEYNLFNSILTKNNFRIFMFNYNYNFDNLDFSTINSLSNINNKYLINLLKEISFFNTTLFYADRNNKLNLKNIDLDIKDNLTKTELIKDVEYKKLDKINTLMYLSPVQYSMNTTGSRLVYEREITLETSPQIVLCESNIPNMMDSITHVDGADSVSVISQGYYFTFIKITGTVGNTMTIRMASPYDMLETIGTKKRSNKGANEKEVVINFQSKIVKDINSINTLNYTPSYEMKFDYNGDPSLEAGDYINVETPYGYKPLFIQKNHFKFDGGLEGYIEGVE